jgi:hypothetical protein
VYNKLYAKIVHSSIWLAPDAQRIAWITLLALMDQDGFVNLASSANLAHVARITPDEANAAVQAFESPDPLEPTQEHEGRRVERVPGGWIVLNAEKYRKVATADQIRQQTRERVRAYRARHRGNAKIVTDALPMRNSNAGVTPSGSVSVSGSGNPKDRKRAFDARGVPGLNFEAWERWLQYRNDTGKPIKPPSLEAAAKKLAKLADQQADAVENSIANGYQGLIAPNAAGNGAMAGAPSSVDAEASARLDELIAGEGAAHDGRTPRDQRAIAAVGGWSVIRERTPHNEARIRKDFCRAYLTAGEKGKSA